MINISIITFIISNASDAIVLPINIAFEKLKQSEIIKKIASINNVNIKNNPKKNTNTLTNIIIILESTDKKANGLVFSSLIIILSFLSSFILLFSSFFLSSFVSIFSSLIISS